MFLLLVSKILPPTSLVLPLIAKYLLFTFIMNTVSILVTVIIINWNFRGPRTHRMPPWIRITFLYYLPIVLLMKRPKKTRLRWMMEMPGMTAPPHPSYGSPAELPKHIAPPAPAKSKMEVSGLVFFFFFCEYFVYCGCWCKEIGLSVVSWSIKKWERNCSV